MTCHMNCVSADSWSCEEDMSITSLDNWNVSRLWSPQGQWVSYWVVQEVQSADPSFKFHYPTNSRENWFDLAINLNLIIIATTPPCFFGLVLIDIKNQGPILFMGSSGKFELEFKFLEENTL